MTTSTSTSILTTRGHRRAGNRRWFRVAVDDLDPGTHHRAHPLRRETHMTKPTASLTLTCPMCGLVVEAPGNTSYTANVDDKGKRTAFLSYGANTQHDCPAYNPPPMEVPSA
jgi:hypothetical protein